MSSRLRSYHVRGKRVRCHPECISGFRSDRQHGLIYGPYRKEGGGWYMDAEEMSVDCDICPYCGSGNPPTIHEALRAVRAMGLTVSRTEHGEFRINIRNGTEATAYYTDDAADAVGTAQHMRQHLDSYPEDGEMLRRWPFVRRAQ